MGSRQPKAKKLVLPLLLVGLLVLMVIFCLGVVALVKNWPLGDQTNTVPSPSSQAIDGNSLQPCVHNPQDQCKMSPSVDFYPTGSESATNPEFKGSLNQQKSIMGRITAVSGNSVTIITSSKRSFAIQFPIDAIANFNSVRSPYYNNLKVGAGDMLYISYTESDQLDNTSVTSAQLFKSSLLVKDADLKKNPDAPIQKY